MTACHINKNATSAQGLQYVTIGVMSSHEVNASGVWQSLVLGKWLTEPPRTYANLN